jgi:DNA phosphorothioation-dependent restriction protein DptH
MNWTNLHAPLMANAFEKTLGRAEPGTMAFARCLTPDIVEALATDSTFAPGRWHVQRVADFTDPSLRTLTADQAVELRENKGQAVLLLVDTALAGAGMDGIYSAAQEVDEHSLFAQAYRLAGREVTNRLSRTMRQEAELAIKKARGFGRRFSLSPWTEFDYLVRISAEQCHPGELLHLLGLWPVKPDEQVSIDEALSISGLFVEHLLGATVSGLTAAQRIDSLKLLASDEQKSELERFLRTSATQPLLSALAQLGEKPELWVNVLRRESSAATIQRIDLTLWRTNTGRIAKWSGLVEDEDPESPPVFILKPDAQRSGDYSKLEVRWKAVPDNLEKDAVTYRVAILTDMDEELAVRDVPHSGKKDEKCRFTNDDFSLLNDDALLSAKVVVTVVGNDQVKPEESEEFTVRFGTPPNHEPAGVGKKVRTFSDGLIELDDRDNVTVSAASTTILSEDTKGFVVMRPPQRGKSFRVYRPPLLREVESQWVAQAGPIGRWRVKVRASGARATAPEFVALSPDTLSSTQQTSWDRVVVENRRMAERFGAHGGVSQVYDDQAKPFNSVVKPYLLAWAALLDDGDPTLALAHTIEVQTLSGKTIGLIVLPSHPLRVAWHVAYDNLMLHSVFSQRATPKDVRSEFAFLDGAMFPAFLPGIEEGSTFVFADMLGFHTVGMVPDQDKEPKAAVAILARAIGESDTADTTPTVGRQSTQVLGNEIAKYIECHKATNLLHVHALRPGDGLTVARSLGMVHERFRQIPVDSDGDEGEHSNSPSFVLELYPSHEQRGVAGRFIAEAREKRRSGAGVLATEDRWMLESTSLPGGMNQPKLRWARKAYQDPKNAAHLAVAFDTFDSRTILDQSDSPKRPLFAYGLLSFFERTYTSHPSPRWLSSVRIPESGEKHPADRTHTERLVRLQAVIAQCVAQHLGGDRGMPVLRTEISYEKARNLRELHRLCDWVITLDRNAGIEYFDSPRDNQEIYDAYVIDAVPEREDMGCLQLITSTSNLDEVRNLLDGALDQMGLSRSRRNAEFLLEHLKALSGRLAIRLTGQNAPNSELIALALSQANCHRQRTASDCWMSLDSGFLIPVDDVLDLLPPLTAAANNEHDPETGLLLGRARPDLIYVSVIPRKGLSFQFIEVKYRRHLRAARSPELLEGINRQVQSLRKRWDNWYAGEEESPSIRAVRRAKLARVLRFYADKAYRHSLSKERYDTIIAEIDRMIERGGDYTFAETSRPDRGWVFCPEYAAATPLEITPNEWETRVFLFGPGHLPDSTFRRDTYTVTQAATTVSTPPNIETSGTSANNAALPGLDQGSLLPPVSDSAPMDSPLPLFQAPTDEQRADPAIVLGTDVLTGTEVSWPLTIKGNPHLLVAGLPGMGKTTCLLNLCTQMVDAGIRPIVFSYHQDIDERLEDQFSTVRFVDPNGLGFNPLQVVDRSSRSAYLDVAGALRDIFVSIYPELGDIQGGEIRAKIRESFVELGWGDPNADYATLVEPPFRRFVEILRDGSKRERSLQTLLVRLDELDDYGFFAPTDSPLSLWESEGPTVIRIHATQNESLQKAFASLVFYGLYKDMFRRGVQQRLTHSIVFDEAHRAARLHLLPTMAKECRKYGISLVVASQEAKDFNTSLFSAIANYLVLRLNETDAKALVRNVSSSDMERMLIDKIKQMDRFRAFYFGEGQKKPSLVSLSP